MCVCGVWFVCSGQENTPGWECAEEDKKTKVPLSFPLLTCKLPVFSQITHMRKVRAAAGYRYKFHKVAIQYILVVYHSLSQTNGCEELIFTSKLMMKKKKEF